jgi:hypothetical protein
MSDSDTGIIPEKNLEEALPEVIIPANKLDADQYSAQDLDGVTEGLFSSGNMAYASLQASQTDAINSMPRDFNPYIENAPNIASQPAPIDVNNLYNNEGDINNNSEFQNSGITPAEENTSGYDGGTAGPGNFSGTTVGSVTAAQLSSDAGSFASAGSGLNLRNGLSDTVVDPGSSSGSDGRDGSTGTDGKDGVSGGGDVPVIDIDVNIDLGDAGDVIDITLNNINDILTEVLNSVTNVVSTLEEIINGDTINSILDLTVVTNLIDTVTNIIEDIWGHDLPTLEINLNALDTLLVDVTIPLDNILETDLNIDADLSTTLDTLNATAEFVGIDAVTNTLQDLQSTTDAIQGVLDQVTTLVSDVDLTDLGATADDLIDTLGNLDETVASVTQGVGDSLGNVLDTLDVTGEDSSIGDTVDGVVSDTTDILDTVTGGLTGDVTDVVDDILDTITDPLEGLGEGLETLLGNENDGGTDGDLTVDLGLDNLGLGEIDLGLDAIEDLTGDLDLNLDLGTDLLGSADGETDSAEGDLDLSLNTGIDIVDTSFADLAENIDLDPIEDIVGDLDINLGFAGDIFDDSADPIVNEGDGGTGEDTLLSDIGDVLGDQTEGTLDAIEPVQDEVGGLIDTLSDSLSSTLDQNIGEDILPANDTSDTDGSLWTEVQDSSGLFDDIINTTTDIGDVLPDPSGTVAEGLGALDIDLDTGSGQLGGLFG